MRFKWPKSASRTLCGSVLAVGLPPAHYGAQHKTSANYFTGQGVVQFEFQSKLYSIFIEKAMCFPQAYAAAVTVLPFLFDLQAQYAIRPYPHLPP